MASRPAAASLALLLLCCVETPQAAPATDPPAARTHQQVIWMLRKRSQSLLHYYESSEPGVLELRNFSLPCGPAPPPPAGPLDSAAMAALAACAPHLRAVRPWLPAGRVDELLQQLDKLPGPGAPAGTVALPGDAFARKRFVLTVLRRFSACVGGARGAPAAA